MTTPEHLQALLERVEKAEGPDRELSRDIYASLGWTRNILSGGMWLEPNGAPVREPADCTASIDAALALAERVLPGQWWSLLYAALMDWRAHVHPKMSRLPLALLAALIAKDPS